MQIQRPLHSPKFPHWVSGRIPWKRRRRKGKTFTAMEMMRAEERIQDGEEDKKDGEDSLVSPLIITQYTVQPWKVVFGFFIFDIFYVWFHQMRKLDRGERERYLLFLLWIMDTWLFVNGSRSTIAWGHSTGSGKYEKCTFTFTVPVVPFVSG